jgi:hypothetical protein
VNKGKNSPEKDREQQQQQREDCPSKEGLSEQSVVMAGSGRMNQHYP